MRFVGFVMSIMVGLGVFVLGISPASAWTGPSKIVPNHSAPLDWCPGNAAICQDNRRLTTLAPNTAVTMVCWIDARIPSGYTYPRWFYVTSGSYQGFVKAELVTNQNPSSPWCLDNASEQRRAVAASLQATGTSEIYQKYPTATDKTNALNVYGFNDWGPDGDWSGDCVMFVGLAWWRAGQTIHHGANAAAIARTYTLNTGTNPPRGAAVFWDWSSVGHVAISLGNGWLVTTQGLDNDQLITTDASMGTVGANKHYLGWTPTP
jgi:hypothetical protein